MFKKCKRGMTVLLAAVMLLTTMLPLTASAASGVTMDLTDCHVSWDYTLTDEEGNTFSAAYGLRAADDIYFGKGFSPYLSKMHDYTAKRKGLTGSKADWEYGRDYVYCFCIERGIPLPDNTQYSASENPNHGNKYALLTENQKDLLRLALTYGYPNRVGLQTSKDANACYAATQLIVWQITMGFRSSATALNDKTYPMSGYSGTMTEQYTRNKYLKAYYDGILSDMATHYTRPSFTAYTASAAKTFEMDYSGGRYTVTLTDTNRVLQNYAVTVLKRIFAAYLDGSSMLTIAEQLNREKIEYRDGVTGWNKGRLKHLIDNTKYLGTEVYPPIIDQETYEKMQKTKHGRNTQKNTDKTQDIFKLTVPVRCPSCGDRMRRRHDSRCKCQERWTCENTACRLRIEIPDAELLTALADLLGTVTADSITLPAETPYEPSTEVIRLNNEISRMLDMAEIDKAVLRSKMTECLARKYKELGNGCCAVQRLKAELGSTADIAERLNRAVSEIRLYTDKTADIILLNGQIIRKESDNGTDCCIPAESGADNRTDRIGQRERQNPLPSPAGGGILPRFH